MSNFAAALSIQLQYTGPSGNQINIPPITVSAEYQAQNVGVIDVPDATASATSYAVPFGAIDDLTTCGIILNQTGQPLELKVNGAAAASQTMPTTCSATPSSCSNAQDCTLLGEPISSPHEIPLNPLPIGFRLRVLVVLPRLALAELPDREPVDLRVPAAL